MPFNQEHFRKFCECAGKHYWRGHAPLKWAQDVHAIKQGENFPGLFDECPSRTQLLEFCSKTESSTDAIFLNVMAWGGMHRKNGERAWKDARQVCSPLSMTSAGAMIQG